MADIFLSYRRTDREIAEKIFRRLMGNNVSVWSDVDLVPGQEWQQIVAKEIDAATLVLAILTPQALESEWQAKELQLAAGTGKLFPVAVGEPATGSAVFGSYHQHVLRDLSDSELQRLSDVVTEEIARRRRTSAENVQDYGVRFGSRLRTALARVWEPTVSAMSVGKDAVRSARHAVANVCARIVGARWVRWAGSAVILAAAALGLLFVAEPFFIAPSPRPIVTDVAFVDGVERVALIEGKAEARIVEEGETVAVLRGHPQGLADAGFVDGGDAIRSVDAGGVVRLSNVHALRRLSLIERDEITLGGLAVPVWTAYAQPVLVRLRDGWRWTTCATGLGAYCPLTSFRDTLRDGAEGPEMVVIRAGSFLMGSSEDEAGRDTDEGPQRIVSVDSFALSRTEVTVGEFRAFAEATGHGGGTDCNTFSKSSAPSWREPGFPQTEAHSVTCVSFEDALAFISWLNAETSGAPYRLPTEAEWEYAARAGTETPYHFGDEIAPELANYVATSGSVGTMPVGSFPANAFGLHDMHGNVWEWVRDCWHDSYEGAPRQAVSWLYLGDGDCALRVLRGGSWDYGAVDLRSALRFRYWRDLRSSDVGFRLARTLPGD